VFWIFAMPELKKSSMTLRIMGDDLVPEEITNLLGAAPTFAHFKGETIVIRKTEKTRIANFGTWQIRAADREPGNLNAQIGEILSKTSVDLAVWQSIAKRFQVSLFCTLYMEGGDEGLTISPQSLAALGARNIGMGLNMIYLGDLDKHKTGT
jgi:hypothetical protein